MSGDIEEALSLARKDATDEASALARINALTSPCFKTAAVTAKSLFNLPLDLSYFIGYLDSFASGDDFVPLFGTASFASSLRGPMVYPEGINGDTDLFYDGIHAVNGTGLRLGTSPKLSSNFVSYLYAYQDADLGEGCWSGDLRALYNTPNVKVEFFAGGFHRLKLRYLSRRASLLRLSRRRRRVFPPGCIPYYDPAVGFSVDNLYFLFEPRINVGFGNIAITVFYHPLYYRQQKNDLEKSALDAAFNLRFGRLQRSGAQGGVEALLKFRPLTDDPLAASVSPYYSMITGGVEWDFKLRLSAFPFPSPWYGMFEPFIGLKTSF